MTRNGFTCVLLLFTSLVFAQNKTNFWYFGQLAGIDFSDTVAQAVTNGKIFTNEGCASIGDTTGELIFYTDGRTVYNKNHVAMQNGTGLHGHNSSTQSAIIVPKPLHDSLYYVFTVDYEGVPNGLKYSVVNINMNGGLGAVISKNVPIVGATCEKITAIKHDNDTNFWIVTHLHYSSEYQAYNLSDTGINLTPVSSYGMYIGGTRQYTIGYMKPSHDGNRLAVAHNFKDSLEIFDFNRSTGQLTNGMRFGQFASTGPYGLEFSPNNQLLYVSTEVGSGIIYQYDLTAGSQDSIATSRVVLNNGPSAVNGNAGALQLGPDGNIYIARWFRQYIGVITNPDQIGVGCNYDPQGFYLGGRYSMGGLPNILYYPPSSGNPVTPIHVLTVENGCEQENLSFDVSPNTGDSIRWIFGDGSQLNKSTDYAPTKAYIDSGSYTVLAVIDKLTGVDTLSAVIQIGNLPTVNLGSDTSLCLATDYIVSLNHTGDSFSWGNTHTAQDTMLTTTTTLIASSTNECGTTFDTINVVFVSPSLDLGEDIYTCSAQNISIDGIGNYDSIVWNTGESSNSIVVNDSGAYTATASIQGCQVVDSVSVYFNQIAIDLGADVFGCIDDTVFITGPSDFGSYLWSNGDTSEQIAATASGWYKLTVSNDMCTASDSILVTLYSYPNVDLGEDMVKCIGDTVLLEFNEQCDQLIWDNGSTSNQRTILTSGLYSLEASNYTCTTRDSLNIQFEELSISLGEDIARCEGEMQEIGLNDSFATMIWNTNETTPSIQVDSTGTYCLRVSNTICTAEDSVFVAFNPNPIVDLGGDRTYCGADVPEEIYLYPNYNYTWGDGSTGPSFRITQVGMVSVLAEKDGCYDSDSIMVVQDDDCVCMVFIPTAFTPNYDINNDGFKGVSNGCDIDNYALSIYNRWGEKLFESTNIDQPWDGSYKGSDAQQGVYLFILSYQIDDKSINTKGTVTLLR